MTLTPETVKKLFPNTPIANIAKHLPNILTALDKVGLSDMPMTLMALATIRAETEGFVPISEGVSKFNTSEGGHPFDKYDERVDLGNIGMYSGMAHKGRGFVQLSGRSNYISIGKAIGVDLEQSPDLANDPVIAADILAYFLKSKETAIRNALENNNLRLARRIVNGGSHGLDRFVDCFERGRYLLSTMEPNTAPIPPPTLLGRIKNRVNAWLG